MSVIKYTILVIEDNPGDFTLVEDFLLEQFESPVIVNAANYREAKLLLGDCHPFNIILLDLSLPDKTGEDLIKDILSICENVPVIVLTGYADFAFGAKSLSLGISDYILKEELTSITLAKSIIYSQERKKAIATIEDSQKQYSELFHLNPIPMWVVDIQTSAFLDVNQAAIAHYGYSEAEFLSMTVKDIKITETDAAPETDFMRLNASKNPEAYGIHKHRKKNGDIIYADIKGKVIHYKDTEAKIILATDITERLNYVKAIEEQNEKLREISWIQSHVVRAPLARIMGLVSLITEVEDKDDDKEKILEYLSQSANELDEVVKNIVKKAYNVNFTYRYTKSKFPQQFD